jgi:hypothetical protein
VIKLWSAFLPDLLPHVPECPEILAEHELRRAAQLFFEKTRAWKVELEAIPVAAGDVTIQVMPDDSKQEIVRIESAWYDDKPLDILQHESYRSTSDWKDDTGTPCEICLLTPAEARLYPIPDAAATTGLRCNVSVKPSDSSSGIPDNLFSKFRDAIVKGAKFQLMLYLNKPWSSPEMAVAFSRMFDADIAAATVSAARGFGAARIPSRIKWC